MLSRLLEAATRAKEEAGWKMAENKKIAIPFNCIFVLWLRGDKKSDIFQWAFLSGPVSSAVRMPFLVPSERVGMCCVHNSSNIRVFIECTVNAHLSILHYVISDFDAGFVAISYTLRMHSTYSTFSARRQSAEQTSKRSASKATASGAISTRKRGYENAWQLTVYVTFMYLYVSALNLLWIFGWNYMRAKLKRDRAKNMS